MEIKHKVKCIPEEMFGRLKEFSEKLWEEKNSAAVELSSIMQEFEEESLSVEELLTGKEEAAAGKLAFAEKQYAEKMKVLEAKMGEVKKENDALSARLAGLKEEREALAAEIETKNEENARLSAQVAEEKSRLVSEFSVKTGELYENLKGKEEGMLKKWEEKNGQLDGKLSSLEREYKERGEALRLKEKSLEEEFKYKKKELIKTFDRVRVELELKERELLKKQEKLAEGEKTADKGTEK